MRTDSAVVALLLVAGAAAPARAEYAVLRNGQRLHITGYERAGGQVRLQLDGGMVEIPAEELVRIDPEDSFPPLSPEQPKVPFGELIRAAAEKHGVDPGLIASVIAIESNFNPRAVSPRQAHGLMQLLPETIARLGVSNAFDPAQNIEAGTRYLKELLERYNQDLAMALAAYNAGPERVDQYGGVPPFAETRNYVRRIGEKLNSSKKKNEVHGAPRGSRSTLRR